MTLHIINQAIDETENTCAHFINGHGEEEYSCALGHELKMSTDTNCMPCCPKKFKNRNPWDCGDMRFPTHEEAVSKVRKLVVTTRRRAFAVQSTMEDAMLKGLGLEEHKGDFPCPLCLHGTLSYTKDAAEQCKHEDPEACNHTHAKTHIVCSTDGCMDTSGEIIAIDQKEIDRLRKSLGMDEYED